jgi:transcription elongation factor Elf1
MKLKLFTDRIRDDYYTRPLRCSSCNTDSQLRVLKSSKDLSILGIIPVASVTADYFAVCKNCGALYKISPAGAEKIKSGHEYEINESDIGLMGKIDGMQDMKIE